MRGNAHGRVSRRCGGVVVGGINTPENDGETRGLPEQFFLLASGLVGPAPPSRVERPWTERVSALSAFATVLVTGGIVWLGYVQYTVNNGQLRVMQQQLNDAEIKDSASIVIRNLVLNGFPDNMVASFDVSNIGATRADMVSLTDPIVSGPKGHPLGLTTAPEEYMNFYQPNKFGFTLAPQEQRHFEVPISKFLPGGPTDAQLISGDYTTGFLITASYKTIFGRIEHVADCAIHDEQPQFHRCFGWGDNKRIESPTAQ
jgi:hypothetical protein